MPLTIESVLSKFKPISGLVHVGAHHGQEWSTYKKYDIPVIFIEPCQDAFKILENKFASTKNVTLFNCAAGASNFTTEMYVEKSNNLGASNSVLKPKKHLEQYPEIKFTEKETVQVIPLDNLIQNNYNILVIDTQGYELEVLKGAVNILKNIDCIYTEANREELYEGCAMIDEIDKFLEPYNLIRTQADWRSKSWGDAVYIKGGKNKHIIIPSCYKYKECWYPLNELMKKYVPLDWPTILITDKADGHPFEKAKHDGTDYGWVENLKKGIENMSGTILFLQDDFFPDNFWDIDFIEKATALMKQEKIECFRLYPCPGPIDEIQIGEINGITYGKIHKGEPYRVSCQAALWDPEFLMSILNKVSGSAGNFEINGSMVDVAGKVYSVLRSSIKWPVSYLCTGIIRGEWNPDAFSLFQKEGVYVINNGIKI